MRVLVTGGTGFVGSHLITALEGGGADITALVRSPEKAASLPEPITRVWGDLHDAEALNRGTEGQDVIFHVAGLVAARNESEFDRVNGAGTRNLVQAAARSGRPRFVYVSSVAAGGPAAAGRPLKGGEPPKPVTAYGRSKLAAEEVVRSSPLPWTIVRPPLVYGPRDREVFRLFKWAKLGLGPVFGSGTQELSAVYGPDLAQALVAAETAEAAIGRTYYPCHREVFTSAEFVRTVGEALERRVRIVPLPEGLARSMLTLSGLLARMTRRATVLNGDKANEFFQAAWTGDPTPLTRDSGWRAEHDLASGLAATAAWYQREGWL